MAFACVVARRYGRSHASFSNDPCSHNGFSWCIYDLKNISFAIRRNGKWSSNSSNDVIAVIGTFTAIFAATIAIAQDDIKRVLAYSTISQLGFMFSAIGIGAYIAAAFHLIMQHFLRRYCF